eukprot:GEZU01015596.1.p1 GENE.GEZU01015596.1~~GEZU01015596.1.p1  ORF type:complete len:238 (-),score=61.43 GEZU01015596.1:143-856(-)
MQRKSSSSSSNLLLALILATVVAVFIAAASTTSVAYTSDSASPSELIVGQWTSIVVPRGQCVNFTFNYTANEDNRLIVRFQHLNGSFYAAGLTSDEDDAVKCSNTTTGGSSSIIDYQLFSNSTDFTLDPVHQVNITEAKQQKEYVPCVEATPEGVYYVYIQGAADDQEYSGQIMPATEGRNYVNAEATCRYLKEPPVVDWAIYIILGIVAVGFVVVIVVFSIVEMRRRVATSHMTKV